MPDSSNIPLWKGLKRRVGFPASRARLFPLARLLLLSGLAGYLTLSVKAQIAVRNRVIFPMRRRSLPVRPQRSSALLQKQIEEGKVA